MSATEDKTSLKREVNWFNVILTIQIVLSMVCGVHFAIYEAYFVTTIFAIILILLGLLGVYAGAHRLWAHHSYDATASLRVFLMLCQTLAGNSSIYDWVRLHRLHHKYFQTDLDPWNSKKGFFYSHIAGNYLNLSPAQEKALEEIDMSDLENDKIVMFQKKYYWILFVVVSLLLPINAPVEYWDESILNSVFVAGWLRIGFTYRFRLLVHSAINVFDFRDQERNAFDSNAVFFINKSYWISYHYLAPWDYQTSELGKYGVDCTSKFIRVCAALELASNLRTVDNRLVQDALAKAVDEKKTFPECLNRLEKEFKRIPSEHYLTPAKFY